MKRALVLSLFAVAALAEDRAPDSVKELWGVRWHSRLDGALADAAKAKKPVMHLRMLGNLSGDS